jgi:hypothetical protein
VGKGTELTRKQAEALMARRRKARTKSTLQTAVTKAKEAVPVSRPLSRIEQLQSNVAQRNITRSPDEESHQGFIKGLERANASGDHREVALLMNERRAFLDTASGKEETQHDARVRRNRVDLAREAKEQKIEEARHRRSSRPFWNDVFGD